MDLLEQAVAEHAGLLADADLVVVNPPRRGLGHDLARRIEDAEVESAGEATVAQEPVPRLKPSRVTPVCSARSTARASQSGPCAPESIDFGTKRLATNPIA